MAGVALFIAKAVESIGDEAALNQIREQVKELCSRFPTE